VVVAFCFGTESFAVSEVAVSVMLEHVFRLGWMCTSAVLITWF
jgi:hypothetical protein